MATLYISEYTTVVNQQGQLAEVVQEPAVADQTVAIGGSSTQSNAFNGATNYIRVHTDSICSILVGASPTALTTSKRLAANQTEYFAVKPLQKLAVISNT